MKNFKVTITETLEREIILDAKSAEHAVDIVERKYKNEEIILDAEDYVLTEFKVELESEKPTFSKETVKNVVVLSYSPTKWSTEDLYEIFLETYKRLNGKNCEISFDEYKKLGGE